MKNVIELGLKSTKDLKGKEIQFSHNLLAPWTGFHGNDFHGLG